MTTTGTTEAGSEITALHLDIKIPADMNRAILSLVAANRDEAAPEIVKLFTGKNRKFLGRLGYTSLAFDALKPLKGGPEAIARILEAEARAKAAYPNLSTNHKFGIAAIGAAADRDHIVPALSRSVIQEHYPEDVLQGLANINSRPAFAALVNAGAVKFERGLRPVNAQVFHHLVALKRRPVTAGDVYKVSEENLVAAAAYLGQALFQPRPLLAALGGKKVDPDTVSALEHALKGADEAGLTNGQYREFFAAAVSYHGRVQADIRRFEGRCAQMFPECTRN